MNQYAAWLNKFDELQPSMLWCHTTDAYVLRNLIEYECFQPQQCEYFNERLTYFFYGRPAYKTRRDENIRHTANAPITIILKPEIVSYAKNIYPFDTGAFWTKRYAKWMHSKMDLSSFNVSMVSNAQFKHVKGFYGSNLSYFDCIASVQKENLIGEFEAEAIAGLISDQNSDDADDRKITFEISTDQSVPFTNKYIDTIVGPKSLLSASWFNDFISKSKINFVPYDLNYLKPAIEYQALFEEKVKNIQSIKGILS